jgi:hypothetical protein
MRTTLFAWGLLLANALALCVLAYFLATGNLFVALLVGVTILLVFARE